MVTSLKIIICQYEHISLSKHTFHKGAEGGDIEVLKEWPRGGENKISAREMGAEQCLVDNSGQSGKARIILYTHLCVSSIL